MWNGIGDKRKASKKVEGKKRSGDQAGIGDDIDRDDCPLYMYVDVQLQDRCVCLRVLEVSMMDVVLVLSSEVEVVLDTGGQLKFTPSLAEKKEKIDNYLNPSDEKSGGVYLTKQRDSKPCGRPGGAC